MRFLKSKHGILKPGVLNTAIIGLVLLVVLFQIYATLVPEAGAAGDSLGDAATCSSAGGFFNGTQNLCLNGTSPADTAQVSFQSIPLAGLFSGTGVVFVIIMAALVILVVKSFLPGSKK